MKRPAPHGSVTVTDGTAHMGTVISNSRGHEAFDHERKYMATFPTMAEARKAIFERYRSSSQQSNVETGNGVTLHADNDETR